MTEHHVQHIKGYLRSQGFTDLELMDDLTDHLATEIEFSMDSEKLDFQTSFERAKQRLLPDSPCQLERDLKILTTPKHNIMIKKIAYLGGYLSALSLCLAILFGAVSYQENLRSDGMKERVMAQMIPKEFMPMTPQQRSEFLGSLHEESVNLKISSLRYLELSQSLLIVAISLFSISYLPYRFYNGYNKSQLELSA